MTNTSAAVAAPSDNAGGLPDWVAAELRRRVASGELPLGSWLRQNTIATELGISRTPVREAIQILSVSGVVELIPNRGARIRVPSPREVEDGYRVRAELEGLAAELAARYATQDQVDRLRAAEGLFEAAVADIGGSESDAESARQQWTRANDDFHVIIVEASRNEVLARTIAGLHQLLPRNLTWNELSRDVRLMRTNVGQHRAVRQAVEDGDGVVARAAMVEHVMRSSELVVLGLGSLTG